MRTNFTLKTSLLWLILILFANISLAQRPVDGQRVRSAISSKKMEMHRVLSNSENTSDSLCAIDTAYIREKTASGFEIRVLPVADTVQYQYRSSGEDAEWTSSYVYDTCCFAIGGLESQMIYQIQVRRWCAATSSYGDWHELSDTTRCEGPSHDQMKLIGLSHDAASMMVESDAAGFEWVIKRTGSTTARHIKTNSNTIEWINLEADTEYECMVRMSCGEGWSDYSPKDTFSTKPYEEYSCGAVTNDQLYTSNVTSNEAQLNCDMKGVQYSWGMKSSDDQNWTVVTNNKSSHIWKNLKPGKTYQYKVKVECQASAWTDWSNTHYFTTKEDHYGNACTTPQSHHMSYKDVTYNSASTYCAVDGAQYHWYLSPYGKNQWEDHTTTYSYYHWKNLKHNTKYQYKVKVKCHDGKWTGWSYTGHFTTHDHYGDPCTTPKSHHMSHKNVTYNSGSTYCDIKGASYHWYLKAHGANDWKDHTTTHNYYDWKGLHYNTTYQYKVKVKCHDGTWTGWSYVGHFTTSHHYGDPCTTPQSHHMSYKNLTYNSASTHCAVSGASYHWYLKPSHSNTWIDHTTTHNYHDWKGLHYNTTYQYKVKVKCHDGTWTGWSYVGHFTTPNHYGDYCTTPESHHMSHKDVTYNSASTYCSVTGAEYHWYLKPSHSSHWIDFVTKHNYHHWTHLDYNTSYDYRVKVKCHDGTWTGWSYIGHFTTLNHYGGDPCTTPQSHHMSHQNVTYNSATTNCSVKGVTYHWYLKPSYSGSSWTDYTTSHNYHHWTNLQYNTSYDYKVKIKCHDGTWTGWSYIGHFTTPNHYGSHCTTPQSHHMSYKNVTYNSASTYCGVSGASYHWYLKPSHSSHWIDYTSSNNYYHWNNLSHNTSYDYKVKVKCHDGTWTGWSYVGHFTTHDHYGSGCSTPQSHHMSHQNVSYNSASTYCAVSGASYHWYLKPSHSSTWTDYNSSNNYYHWNNLHYNTSYDYKVKVKCHDGTWTGWSYIGHFTTHDHYDSYCSAPAGGEFSGTLEAYNLFRIYLHVPSIALSTGIRVKGTWDWWEHTSTATNMAWGNLSPNTEYEYRVRRKCANGILSDWSQVRSFWTGSGSSVSSGRQNTNDPLGMEEGLSNLHLLNQNSKEQPVEIFPSPAYEQITVRGALENSEMIVVDMQGQIQFKSVVSSSDRVNVGSLGAGVYHVIVLNQEGNRETKKLVILQ